MSTMEFVCITCGGNRGVREGGFIKCKHCGNRYRLRPADDNIRISLQYALNERQDADFDKARRRYDKIIADNDGSADLEEAYWGRFLCEQYVIFYQNDAGESIPSFWNINETACEKSDSYRKALSYGAESGNKENYEQLAQRIEAYKAKYRNVKKEYPEGYQVFICFKDSGTTDANLGYKIYNEFAGKYNVFFSRESLNEIKGNDYEPYIYHALKTSSVMIVLCSSKESLESKWVHNEWWRFWRFSMGSERTIIPVFRNGFDASGLPDEIRNCQAHDEDVRLISVLGQRLSAILQNSTTRALSVFDRKLNTIEATWQARDFDGAKEQIAVLIRDSAAKPHDHVRALLVQAKFLSDNFRYLSNKKVKEALSNAMDVAKHNDVPIRDLDEYQPYRKAVSRKRTKTVLLSLLIAAAIAGGAVGTVMLLHDPLEEIYVTGNPSTVEMEYGDNLLDQIPTITTVTRKGKEATVEVSNAMISGFDPSKVGVQTVTVTYEGMEIRLSVNVSRYTLDAPASITMENGRVTWSAVSKAESYTLMIGDETVSGLTANTYEGDLFTEPGVYAVKVKAVAEGSYGKDSAFSQTVSVVKLKEAFHLRADGASLTWDAVPGCTKYDIYLADAKIGSAATNEYRVPAASFATGENTLYVVPVDAHNLKLFDELTADERLNYDHNSEVTLYKHDRVLRAALQNGALTWPAVDGATSYAVYINGVKADVVTEPRYVPKAAYVQAGENTAYVVPVGGCMLSTTPSADEDYATGGEVALYKYDRVQSTAFKDGALTWEAVEGTASYTVYVNGVKATTVSDTRYVPEASRMQAGKNTVYVVPVDGCVVSATPSADADYATDGEVSLYKFDRVQGLSFSNGALTWPYAQGCSNYAVYINGVRVTSVSGNSYIPDANRMQVGKNTVYVMPVDGCVVSASASDGADYALDGEMELYKYGQASQLNWNGQALTWASVSDNATYAVYLNGNLLRGGITGNSYTPDVNGFSVGNNVLYVVPENGGNLTDRPGENTDFEHNGEITVKKLAAVTGLTLTSGKISWTSVDGATEYEVLRNGEAILKTSNNYCSISMDSGHAHSDVYTVRAYGDSRVIPSDVSAEEIVLAYLEAPVNLRVSDGYLWWDEVRFATGYEVYAGDQLVGTVEGNNTLSMNMLGRLPKGDYTLQVVAKGNGENIQSSGRSSGVAYSVDETIVYITSEQDLKNMRLDMDALYVLGNDITLTGAWTPVGTTASPFVGRFNGGGHTIYNLNVTATGGQGTGLFGVVGNGGIVENVVLENATCNGASNYGCVGAVVGINRGTVREATVSGTVSATGDYVGGIIGRNYGSVYDCVNHATVTGKKNVGGIAGSSEVADFSLQLYGCKNDGNVQGSYRIGGIAGYVTITKKITVSHMTNAGSIVSDGNYAGGIFGYVSGSAGQTGTMVACVNSGDITATDYAAGCFGFTGNYVTVTQNQINDPQQNCTNTGTVLVTGGSHSDEIYVK